MADESKAEFIARLEAATEDDVVAALDGAYVELPLKTPIEALQFFSRMIWKFTGELDDEGGGD
jgi:hypothetical protein